MTGRWFVSIQVEMGDYRKPRTGDSAVGVDLGISASVTLSTGEVCRGPRSLRRNLKRLRRLARRLPRKQHGSKRRARAKAALAKLHARIKNIRHDWIHKLTSKLVRENHAIGVEGLHVGGTLRNRCLARSIADECFAETLLLAGLSRCRTFKLSGAPLGYNPP